jgi:hypothetical protein
MSTIKSKQTQIVVSSINSFRQDLIQKYLASGHRVIGWIPDTEANTYRVYLVFELSADNNG